MGETCGLKLIYKTKSIPDVCKLCGDMAKKQRRYDKMYWNVKRWEGEGNRRATIERTNGEMLELQRQIKGMSDEHAYKLRNLGQG
ncbi:hypothetical protein RJ55_03862 [Drechmeria coniospora]|nr:hypothetical protein RJ55_03862 [Drechmeria coniospora]